MNESLKNLFPEAIIKQVMALSQLADTMNDTDDLWTFFGQAIKISDVADEVKDFTAELMHEVHGNYIGQAFVKASWTAAADKLKIVGTPKSRGQKAEYTIIALQAMTYTAPEGEKVAFSTLLRAIRSVHSCGGSTADIRKRMLLPKEDNLSLNTQRQIVAAAEAMVKAKKAQKKAEEAVAKKAALEAEYNRKVEEAKAAGTTIPKKPAALREKEEPKANAAPLRRIGNSCELLSLNSDLDEKYLPAIAGQIAVLEALQKAIMDEVAKANPAPATVADEALVTA